MLKELLSGSKKKDSLILAVQSFIKVLNVKITPGEIEDFLLKSPNYPSLACITDLLNYYKIENLALSTTTAHLPQMEFPALAHVTDDGGKFIVVRGIENDAVTYLVDNKWIKESVKQFSTRWGGTILMAEGSEESGDPDYIQKKRRESFLKMKRLALLFLLIICTLGGSLLSHSYSLSFALVLLMAGCIVTMVIRMAEFTENSMLDEICRATDSLDCHAVLASPAAKIFGFIPVTAVGFLYFTFMYTSLLFGIVAEAVPIEIITLFSIVALPYAAFSIYYQYIIIKKWCSGCLIVQSIVVLLALNLLIANYPFTLDGLTDRSMNILCVGFMVPLAYMLLNEIISESRSTATRDMQRKLARWTRNSELFEYMLSKEKHIDVVPFDNEIVLGNPMADSTILMVINPNCKPCEKRIKEMFDVYSLMHRRVKIFIRFNFDRHDKLSVHVVNQLLLCTESGEDSVRLALRDKVMLPFEKWMEKYNESVPSSLEKQRQHHLDWCMYAGIHATPTIFVNGCQLAEHYTIFDLPYVIPHIKN